VFFMGGGNEQLWFSCNSLNIEHWTKRGIIYGQNW
jgi:hypothetical protein